MRRTLVVILGISLITSAFAQASDGPREFTEAMFGHLGVVKFDCPAGIEEMAGTNATPICGTSDDSFDLFRQQWDLYADWESQIPVVAFAIDAWEYTDGRYTRGYAVANGGYIVNFYEAEDGYSGHVLIMY